MPRVWDCYALVSVVDGSAEANVAAFDSVAVRLLALDEDDEALFREAALKWGPLESGSGGSFDMEDVPIGGAAERAAHGEGLAALQSTVVERDGSESSGDEGGEDDAALRLARHRAVQRPAPLTQGEAARQLHARIRRVTVQRRVLLRCRDYSDGGDDPRRRPRWRLIRIGGLQHATSTLSRLALRAEAVVDRARRRWRALLCEARRRCPDAP